MEPGGERRDHLLQGSIIATTGVVPQWGPPLNGGSRARAFRAV